MFRKFIEYDIPIFDLSKQRIGKFGKFEIEVDPFSLPYFNIMFNSYGLKIVSFSQSDENNLFFFFHFSHPVVKSVYGRPQWMDG